MADKQKGDEKKQADSLSQPQVIRDVFIVGSPIIVFGIIGNLIGLSTLAGGAVINLGYLIMIVVGAGLLQKRNSGWREIGLNRPAGWLKTALSGVAVFVGAVVLFLAVQGIAVGLLTALGLTLGEIDQSRFNPIEGNLPMFILMVALAWTTIAFGEELFFRAFLISRMVDFTRIDKGYVIWIAGAVFGAAHFAEGPVGVLANASFGVFFGWIYLRSARNLWITIIGHGLLNTLRFSLLFAGAA
ncbi:MAG: CPBP family intramembrane glutamic endopeptidase [Calditrichaceae bacterium]